jgi:hypothetical protein
MAVATFAQPDFTTQNSATYKANIDGATSVLSTIGRAFAPHESSPAAMTMTIDPGEILVDGVVVSQGAQTSSAITAPVADSRIDMAVIDCYTGALSIITGVADPSPVPPVLPTGKVPVSLISVTVGQASILNIHITDKRAFFTPTASLKVDQSYWGMKNLRLVTAHSTDHTKVVINPDSYRIPFEIGDTSLVIYPSFDVSSVNDLDTGSLAAGTDYYIYACTDGTTLSFKVSANSTNPTGFDAAHSRKIGGFHTLCVAVGTISGHALTNYAQKDILPASIWDLKHRAKNLINVGLVYDSATQKWVDIYLASGTGASTTSVNGGTISDTRNWMDFVDDGHAVGKRLSSDHEFTSLAAGSNEETNISGSADPGTTGGHNDSAGRRMVSNIGCEDCCGALYQWLLDQSYYPATPAWVDLPGSKGSLYTGGDVKLIAGGIWDYSTNAGSRCRYAAYYRWSTASFLGARFASEPL